jgi:hypothetical protein
MQSPSKRRPARSHDVAHEREARQPDAHLDAPLVLARSGFGVPPAGSAPPHRDSLRHQPFKISLALEAVIRRGRRRPEMLRGSLTYRHSRGRPWEKRARYGIAVPDVGDGQDAGGDRALSPTAESGPEQRSVLGRAKALRRPAAARLEILFAP